jgi:Flp pilus assembly protein TadD
MRARLFKNALAASMLGACCWLGMPGGVPLRAQDIAPPHPARFDPSDVYFQGFLAVRAAEQLEAEGDFAAALEKLRQAESLFHSVRKFYPEWQPDMVIGRGERTSEAIAAVAPKAEKQLEDQRRVIAELEGGQRVGGEWIDPNRDVAPLTPGILEVDPLASRRLQEAEAEVARLRGMLNQSNPNAAEASRDASRVRDLQRQRDDLQARLRAAETNVQALRARLATSPAETQLGQLNRRIEELEQERAAMALALSQSRGSHAEAMAKSATLEADMRLLAREVENLRQREADIQRDMEREREVANDVVAGLRRQNESLARQLKEKEGELASANATIAGLTRELAEARDAYADLSDERDQLLRERDQMAALLQLNEGSRIQELIEQNMGLARQLREANERVDRLNIDGNATKDQLTDAQRDLAIAKAQINRLQQDRRDQEQRLTELEQRLRNEDSGLAAGTITADPAEVEVLRDIIRRQGRALERRRQARELLVEAARDLGRDDERIAQAIELMDGREIELTPDEQRLIASNQVDGEFISPFARDRQTVGRAMADLNLELESYDRAATRAFAAGRYLPTRELFQQMVELNPGHTPALCKLGVVHLKLEDPEAAADAFQRAVELDGSNAYAHRMLAYSHIGAGNLSAAIDPATRAVDLAPDDALAQLLLGTISFRTGQPRDAESHFKAAISADPMLSEPYFNLAILYIRENRTEEARQQYALSLERGAVPDPSLEQTLYP